MNISKLSPQEMASPLVQNLSPQQIMIQVQVMLLESFDSQIRDAAESIKGSNMVFERYGQNLDQIQSFQAKAENSSREDSRRYFEASADQARDVMTALETVSYSESKKDLEVSPFWIEDTGSDHEFENEELDNRNDHSSTEGWANVFDEIANSETTEQQFELSEKIGDDDGELFFYFGHTNNKFVDGRPKFSFFADGIDRMTDRVRHKMDQSRQRIDKITTQLTQLTQQRKQALDQLGQLLNQKKAVREEVLNIR